MEVTLSDVYHWRRPKLEETCKQWNLCVEGSDRELRERLTSYIRSLKGNMDTKCAKFEGGSNEEGDAVSESSQGIRDKCYLIC